MKPAHFPDRAPRECLLVAGRSSPPISRAARPHAAEDQTRLIAALSRRNVHDVTSKRLPEPIPSNSLRRLLFERSLESSSLPDRTHGSIQDPIACHATPAV